MSRSRGATALKVSEAVPERLEKAQRYLDQIAAQWDDAADRLKAFVEDQ